MLIQFTVDNFRSIKDTITFSLVSGSNNNQNVFSERGYSLLPSAVIYGKNASGKSNILKAFSFMKNMVMNVKKVMQSTDTLAHEPFKLSTETAESSSTFEVIFLHKETKYRYGFEADDRNIYSEWLFSDIRGKEAKLFFREAEANELYVNADKFKEGKGIKVLPNSLFLWKCDQEGGEVSQAVLDWFKNVNYLDGIRPSDYMNFTLNRMVEEDFRKKIVKLVTAADLDIQDVVLEEKENVPAFLFSDHLGDNFRTEFPHFFLNIKAVHSKFDEEGKAAGHELLDLFKNESEGTKKFFGLSAPFIDTLKEGKVLLVDELDASMHPFLTMALVSMFHNPSVNTKKAQLIFATHDMKLLTSKMFHKSQIWLTEKDEFGGTRLSSLLEFKNIRPSDNIEKHYMQGKYGAIPFLHDLVFEEE